MFPSVVRGVLLLVVFFSWTEQFQGRLQEQPNFPDLSKFMYGSYESTVEITKIPENLTAYVSEYYDAWLKRGRLNFLMDGKSESMFYDNETRQLITVAEYTCDVKNIISSLFYYEALYLGWLDNDSDQLLIGPTAMLLNAVNYKPEFLGNGIVRGINTNRWSHTDPNNPNLTITYDFSVPSWNPAFGMDMSTPVRISVTTKDNNIEEAKDFSQVLDFVGYLPFVRDLRTFQPPVGIGCPGRRNVKKLPKFGSKVFYMGEEYNLKEHEDSLKSFIHLYRVYFDSLLKLVRFDTWGDDGLEVEIQDFNTGISYNINKEKSCTRGPITNSPAEKYGLGFLGSLKNSTEFLSLDRNYYHIGYDFIRGIRCDVWESVARNVTIGDKTYVKYVLTYYFMTQWWQSVVNGIPQYQKPVRYQITGYEKDNAEPTFKEQYNMFAFRDSGVDLKLFEKFNIEDCEFEDDMEYFQVIFELDRNKVAIAEMNDQLFRTYLVILLAADMRVSPIRLPFLRADYSETSILVSVLLLEKPPSLTGFSLFDVDSFRIPRKTEKDAGRVENIDECATKCLQEKSPLCKSIHYCDHQCFLNSKDLTEEWGDPIGNYKNCDFYIRAVSDAVVFQSTNEEALKNLETSVNKSFIVRITPPTSDDSVDYKVTSVIRNSGYYRFKDETYITVAEDYQLDGYSQTTRDLGNVGTRADCFKRCREATSLVCSSFSYCATDKDRTCRISSVLIRKDNEDDEKNLETNTHCEVYSRNYLMFYDKYEGKVFLTGGDKTVDGASSPEECAKMCRSETEFRCRGFEYCEDKITCILHKKHVLDIDPSNMVTAKATCSHYAAKFIADYLDMGRTLIDDKDSKVFSSLTLEECARLCSEQPEYNCKSFNYCPSESEKDTTYAECSLTSKTLTSPGIKTKDSVKCQHFAKRDAVNDWNTKKGSEKDDKPDTSGYSGGGLAALLIGMLLLGAVLGICVFFVYSFYKNRKNPGVGMSVKFVNSEA